MQKEEYLRMFAVEDRYWWYRILDDLVLRFVCDYVNAHGQVSILDAGCGTGRLIKKMSMYGTVDGFDFQAEAVAYSKLRGFTDIKKIDINEWNPPQEFYDVITSIDVLYHKMVDDTIAIAAMYKALKPGGICIINVPAFSLLARNHDTYVHGARRYTKHLLQKKCEQFGFTIQYVTYRLPHIFFILYIKKWIEKFFIHQKLKSDIVALPFIIEKTLLFFGKIENVLNRYISFPIGSSLFIVVKKK